MPCRPASYPGRLLPSQLVALLERNGVRILALRTKRPGYVVYEDDFQVVAEPFTDTERRPTSIAVPLIR